MKKITLLVFTVLFLSFGVVLTTLTANANILMQASSKKVMDFPMPKSDIQNNKEETVTLHKYQDPNNSETCFILIAPNGNALSCK